MEKGIKIIELQDENMKKIIVIISEIKSSSDWNKILEASLEKKETELKFLIEVNSNFIIDEKLDIKEYFDSFIKSTNFEEASDIVNGIKGILDPKGVVNLNITDIVSLDFKNGKEVFFRKFEGQNLVEIKKNLEKIKSIEGIKSLVFHLENMGGQLTELTVAGEIHSCISTYSSTLDIMFSISDKKLSDKICLSVFFSK